MKYVTHLGLFGLLFGTASAFAGPVPLDEMLSTPAGRWLMREVGGATESNVGLRRVLKLQERYERIAERYREAVSKSDDLFAANATAILPNDKRLVLELIAREELGEGVQFISTQVPGYASSTAAFGRTETPQVVQGLGSFLEAEGQVVHALKRPFTNLDPSSANQPFEKTLLRVLRYLDVRSVTREVVLIPGVRALNARLGELNRNLRMLGHDEIPVTFTDQIPENGFQRARMLANGRIPIRLRGDLEGFDPIETLGAMLLTREQDAVLRADFDFLRAFQAHFITRAPELANTAASRAAFHSLWKTFGSRAGGNPAAHAASESTAATFRRIGGEVADGGGTFRTAGFETTPSQRLWTLLAENPSADAQFAVYSAMRSELRAFTAGEGAARNVPDPVHPGSGPDRLELRLQQLSQALRLP